LKSPYFSAIENKSDQWFSFPANRFEARKPLILFLGILVDENGT